MMTTNVDHADALQSDRAFVDGLPLKELRRLWKENQKSIRCCWRHLDLYILDGHIDRKWKVLAPEFAKHGIGFDHNGNEVPLEIKAQAEREGRAA